MKPEAMKRKGAPKLGNRRKMWWFTINPGRSRKFYQTALWEIDFVDLFIFSLLITQQLEIPL